jgi:hypothetical protein
MAESRASDAPLVLSGVGVGGLFEQVHGVVVEAALVVPAWGVEEGSLGFGKVAVQQAHGHEYGFHSVAPVVLEELLEGVRVAGGLPDGPGAYLHGSDACCSFCVEAHWTHLPGLARRLSPGRRGVRSV